MVLQSQAFVTRYRFIRTIGKGSFGAAMLVRSNTDGKRYVAKVVDSSSMTPKERRDISQEIRILSAIAHPNIIRYKEHFEDGNLIFIVMEYADGGDLNSRIKEAKKQDPPKLFDPNLAMFWFLQICMALKYLHDNHILHRDLKTANIFLTSKNVVKLGDFGISTVLQNTMACASTVCGTPYYFSPELCKNRPYNNKSDVWALGVVFYETLTLQRPFNAKTLRDLLKRILSGQFDPIPNSVPAEMRALCASLLQVDSTQRPSINRILESTYVQECLRGFSADLERQAERDRNEYEARHPNGPPKAASRPPPEPTPPPTAAAPQQPQMSEQDQLKQLRAMGRANMRAALAKQPTQDERPPEPTAPAGATAAASEDVDDDGDYVAQKKAIVKQTKEIVGKKNLGGHPDEFGDAPADDGRPQVETITLWDGHTLPAAEVRGVLEKEMGRELLDAAVDMYNSGMMGGLSNVELQRELSKLVGPQFGQHANAITKLAVWEGKQRAASG